MSINPLQTVSTVAAPRDACVERKGTSGGTGFDALLQSLAGSDGKKAPSPQAAAELLRIRMLESSLALAAPVQEITASASQAPAWLSTALESRFPAAYRGTAALETAEAEDDAVQSVSNRVPAGTTAEIEQVSQTAARFLGIPYRFGGESADGIDCSSFVQQVFHANQIDLPRTAREQINVGSEVAPGDLRKGDLVFFQTYASYPSHVGIYLGDGKMIHASSGKGEVTISDMNSDYYRPRYLGAKRVI